MEAAYVGVKLWAQAVEKAGSDEVTKIREAMLGQKFKAPEGMVTIDPATQHAFKTPRVGEIGADGQFDVVWQAVRPEAPQPFPPSRTRQEWTDFLDGLYKGWHGHWSAPSE